MLLTIDKISVFRDGFLLPERISPIPREDEIKVNTKSYAETDRLLVQFNYLL